MTTTAPDVDRAGGFRILRVHKDAPARAASGGGSPVGRAEAWVRSHGTQAGAGAVAAVVAVALFLRHKAAAGGTASATSKDPGTGVDLAGVTTPNTQASDIENWVQDALNAQQAAVDAALANPAAPAAPTTPDPAPKPVPTPVAAHFIFGAAAKGLKYVRNTATRGIYQVQPDGTKYKLTPAQYASLGKPKFTDYYDATYVKPPPKPKPKPVPKRPAKGQYGPLAKK